MKKAILCLVLIFTAGIVFSQTNTPTIVVSTFSTRGQAVTADDAESITELFIAELAKQSGVRVVDRTSLDRVLTEMRFQISDWSDSQKTAQLGAALNAEFLVRGQVNQLGQQISVVITALDIKTLEVVSSSTETFDVNRIYDTERYHWGDYRYTNIFGKMSNMTRGIANPIKTKMEEIAKQRIEEQEEQVRSRYLIGNWRIPNSDILLTFNTDNTFSVTNYESQYIDSRPIPGRGYEGLFELIGKGNVIGTYRRNGDTIEMVYRFTYVENGTFGGERVVTNRSGSEEKRDTMKFRIDVNNGVLHLDKGFIRRNDRFVNPYGNPPGLITYYNEFIRAN